MKTFGLDEAVVVVIGSGAGGGTMADELSRRGIDVVCLEAGGPVTNMVTDVAAMFPRVTWLEPRIGSGELPPPFPVWSGTGIGGSTLHWTASVPRIPDEQFAPGRYFGDLDGCSVTDWPVPLTETHHYYDAAEKSMGVSGTHGWPKLPDSNHFRLLAEGARRIGLTQAVKGNMAINSVAHGGRPACRQLGFCASGCAIGAKWTSANAPLARALGTRHFELRDRSFVLRVEHDANGRADAVVYVDHVGNLQRQKARVVCMAANAIDTPRILLNSESAKFPSGLANRSGQVGRNYVKHVFAIVTAVMPKPVNFHRGTTNLGQVNDFVPHDAKRGFAGGFKFEQVTFDPEGLVNLSRPGAWGRDYTRELELYNHYSALLVMGDDPAQPDNGVTLHPTEKDSHGMPLPVVHYVSHENSNRMRRFAVEKARELYESLGSSQVYEGPLPPATHNMGTCRMAKDPDDGVCDAHGRSFDVPNLFMSDGSALTCGGSSNPTLTIVAMATRQAAFIGDAMARKQL